MRACRRRPSARRAREPHRRVRADPNRGLFFYFYPDADGNMQAAFSKTYEEHQQAIADNSNAGGADGRAMLPPVKARPPKGALLSSGATHGASHPRSLFLAHQRHRYRARFARVRPDSCAARHRQYRARPGYGMRAARCGDVARSGAGGRGELLFALEQLARPTCTGSPASWRCPSWPRP